MTSSPGLMSIAMSASSSASVPEETAIAWRTPSIRASSLSSAVISGPMMNRWLSQTRSIAARISARSGRYCASRSSSGTFSDIGRLLNHKDASSSRFDGGTRLAIGLAPLDRLALVELLLAFGERHGHLDAAVLEIQTGGDERHAALDRLPDQLPDFLAMEEELAAAQRLVVRVAAVAVGADVDVVEKDLAVLDAREAVAQ